MIINPYEGKLYLCPLPIKLTPHKTVLDLIITKIFIILTSIRNELVRVIGLSLPVLISFVRGLQVANATLWFHLFSSTPRPAPAQTDFHFPEFPPHMSSLVGLARQHVQRSQM